jgi:hypothetical protein
MRCDKLHDLSNALSFVELWLPRLIPVLLAGIRDRNHVYIDSVTEFTAVCDLLSRFENAVACRVTLLSIAVNSAAAEG